MAAARHAWRTGDRLLVRGAAWHVLERSIYKDCESLRLGTARRAVLACRTILLPFDRPRRLPDSDPIRILTARAWLHAVRAIKADATPAGGLSAAAGSRVSILAYQLEPALLMRRHGVARVMIADGVGLGKTIQAGLLLAELTGERDALRALVVVPAGLREQWIRELAAHFGIETVAATSAWLAHATAELPYDVNPWAIPGVYVASSDLIKRPEVLRPLEDVTWDAVIVDEAHESGAGTARRAAVHAVACRASRVVLLTATPHTGDAHQFSALCAIGAHDAQSPPIVMFRRSRADVGTSIPRRTRLVSIRLSPHERRMHRLLEAYTALLWNEGRARGERPARLIAVVLRKRALSSAASLAASCRRRLALLDTVGEQQHETQLLLPLADEDQLADAEPDGVLGGPGLADHGHERQLLADIAAAAQRASAAESKIRFLQRFIARLREPAIVFTEYRDTLARLCRRLSSIRPDLRTLHGGMDLRERESAQAAFNAGSALLIATDAASEGLNLHVRCRLVIHFELPWTPARLEQRTGRVDRIGQSRRVHETLLVCDDTAEHHVLAPLLARAARSRSSVPRAGTLVDALAESEVAAAIIEGLDRHSDAPHGDQPSFREPPPAIRQEAAVEAARLTERRQSQTKARPTSAIDDGTRVPAAAIRRTNAVAPGIYAFFTIALTTQDARCVHRDLVVAHCEVARSSAQGARAALRTLVDRFRHVDEPVVRANVRQHYLAHLEDVAHGWSEATALLIDRERSILHALPSPATQLVQAGLFDQRAVRMSTTRSHLSASFLEEAGRRIDALSLSSDLEKSTQLCAFLVVATRRRR
jgi:superfamily II DNA or RNA helicase